MKSKRWTLAIRQAEVTIPIGTLELANIPNSFIKRLAFIAAAAGKRGGTLVYANGAADSADISDLISQLQPELDPKSFDPELAALAELARKGVHPNFRLAPLVEQGVAFHFGNMPSLLCLEIERLLQSGKIRFLVCTSTLVEGVNLSCRMIVVRGLHKGKGNPIRNAIKGHMPRVRDLLWLSPQQVSMRLNCSRASIRNGLPRKPNR